MAIRFLSGETIDGNATFSGTVTAAGAVTLQKSIQLPTTTTGSGTPSDVGVLSFGGDYTTGNRLFVDSSGGTFRIQGSANLQLFAPNHRISNSNGALILAGDTGVRLYYLNSEKLTTTSTGLKVSGNIKLGDDTMSTPSTNADDIVIDKDASEAGITMMSETAGSVRWGDASNSSVGSIEYNHNSDYMRFIVNAAERMRIDNSGNATFEGQVNITSAGSAHFGITNTNVSGSSQQYLQYVGSNGDYVFRNATDSTSPLVLAKNNNATFAGDVTVNGTITLGTASFVGTVAGATVVSAEGAYASSGSVKLYEAKRSGGAVGGDWSYDDATTDMSLGTNTNHAFSLKTNNTRRLTISNDGEIRVANQTLVKGSNSKYNMTFPDNGGIAIGSAYTFANVYGSSGDLYLRANSYPANTGSNSTIYLQTSNSSGGQANDVVIQNGNVGIGTTSPDFALDIEAVSSGVQLQMGRTTTSAGSTWMGSDSNGFHLGVGAYGTGNSVADPNGFTVLTSGNVGIGTTSPDYKLTINNTGGADTLLKLENTTSNKYPNIRLVALDASYDIGVGGTGTATGYVNNFYIYDVTNSAPRITLTQAGNVGIGTTSPSELLTVNGNMQLGNGGGGGYLKYNTGNLYIQGTSNIVATFESTGNVGIGTTSPESLLAVKGGTAVSDLFSISDNVVPTSGAEYGVMMIKTASVEFAQNITAYGLTSKGLRVYNNGGLVDRTAFSVENASDTNFVVDGLGQVGIGAPALPTDVYTASGGGYAVLGMGQSSFLTAYKADDSIELCQNTYLNTSGANRGITASVAAGRLTLVDGSMVYQTLQTAADKSQTAQNVLNISAAGLVQISSNDTSQASHEQTFAIKKGLSSAGTVVPIAFVDHTHALDVTVIIKQNTANVASGKGHSICAYGTANTGMTTVAGSGNVTGITLAYLNTNPSGQDYVLTLTWAGSGASPDAYITIRGNSTGVLAEY